MYKKIRQLLFTDDIKDAEKHFIEDHLGPMIQDFIYKAAVNALEMLFYGNVKNTRSSSSGNNFVSYTTYYKNDNSKTRAATSTNGTFITNYNDFCFASKAEAEDKISQLGDIIDSYGYARIADYFEICGEPINGNHTLNNYGWYNLQGTTFDRVYDENGELRWNAILPKARPLNK